MICASTRAGALQQLADFVPLATRYARDRNFVKSTHDSVSRLSPAIRHRLITEQEVAEAVMAVHPLARVEKFIQEVYWRRYWKSWLSLRPEVWISYQESLRSRISSGGGEKIAMARRAELGNRVIDSFARELVSTGYLHNHARMWFAAWWIHEARLPWELGAEFFLQHLLDGDPASNTLSWRWVAGLHTPGKTYLARRANLEKYLSPELTDELRDGLGDFENPTACLPLVTTSAPVTRRQLEPSPYDARLPTGLWIHEEDLTPETSQAGEMALQSIIVSGHAAAWDGFPDVKRTWLASALEDAAHRATQHWHVPVVTGSTFDFAADLIAWAQDHGIRQIVTMRPEAGPLEDRILDLERRLGDRGIGLSMLDRPHDLELRPLATGGFFKFWENMKKRELIPESAPRQQQFRF
jgi:deoxyribodipyrimidine photo-lyase